MYVFSIGLDVISWAFKKQPTDFLFTIEAKYHAMSIIAQKVIYLRHLIKEIGYELGGSSLISLDN